MSRPMVMTDNAGARLRTEVLIDRLCEPWRAWLDRRVARACCREVLRIDRLIAQGQPWLERPARHRKIVAAVLGIGDAEAQAMLVCAQASFATWPVARELALRDVAHYLAVSQLLKLRGEAGVRTSVKNVVLATIPAGL